jgi:hypothetical protein
MSAESAQHPSIPRENSKQPRQSNREKSEKQIGVRLPRELIEYIEGESRERNVSTSEIVREAIEFYGFPHLWARRLKRISELLKSDTDLGRYASYEEELRNKIRFLKYRLKAYERPLKDLERRYEMFQELKKNVTKSFEKIQRDIEDGSDPQE